VKTITVVIRKLSENRPVANLLITGGGVVFLRFWTFFGVRKSEFPCSGCLEETLIFKIMIDDVTLWSKL